MPRSRPARTPTSGPRRWRWDSVEHAVYVPDARRGAVYDRLYAEYSALHDYFGRGPNDVMHRLRAIKREARR